MSLPYDSTHDDPLKLYALGFLNAKRALVSIAVLFALGACSSAPTDAEPGATASAQEAASQSSLNVGPSRTLPLPDAAGSPRASTPSTTYEIPTPGDRHGSITVTSMGITEVRRSQSTDPNLPALHVRLEIANESAPFDWTLDTRLQVLKPANAPSSASRRPAIVRAQGEQPPFVTISPGETRTIDLYYALASASEAATVGGSLDWQLNTGDDLIARTVLFGDTFEIGSRTEIPFDILPEASTYDAPMADRGPASEPFGPSPKVGVESDWILDPFADLPPTWQDTMY